MRFCEERTRIALGAVLCLALALRLLALLTLARSMYHANLMPDEQVYDQWARLLLEGKAVPHVYDFPSAPAHVFAALYRAFGASSNVIRAFDLVLGTATCGVMYVVGAQLKSRFVGVLCALLSAVYGPFVLFSVTAHNTALGVFVFACLLAVAARCFERPSAIGCGALGAAIAAATCVRPNSIALSVFALGWLLLVSLRARVPLATVASRLGAFAVGLALLWLPGAGVPEPAFNFYLANTLDNPSPYFRPVRFTSSEPAQQATGFVVEASVRADRALSLAEAHDFWIAELGREWRAQPRAALAKLVAKVGASLHPYEAANNHSLAFLARFVPGLALPYANFAFLLACAVIGLLQLRRASNATRGLAVLAFGYWCTLLIFFTDSRLRAPLALALVPFAALGIEALWSALVERDSKRGWKLGVSAVLVFAAASLLPVPGAGDLSTAYNFHALFLFEQGDLDQAESFYRESSELGGSDSPSAYLGLAAIAERKNDPAAAKRYLSLIPDTHYKAAEKYLQLGALLTRARQLVPASDAFARSLQINPSTLEIYPILIALQQRTHAPAQAEQTLHRYALVKALYR